LRRKLESARDQAFLSKQLAILSTNAPAVYDAEACRYQGALPAAIDPLWQELGFERLRQRIPHWKVEA
jgi:5'-3' exonuclease